jgi:antitoxin (DNA-binding transcriptional repressor) of toxin-antitoxin stability system
MKTVGVRELKNRLSEYLREVRRGESVLVTDRGDVVAEFSPPRHGAIDPRVPAALLALASGGWVRWEARLTICCTKLCRVHDEAAEAPHNCSMRSADYGELVCGVKRSPRVAPGRRDRPRRSSAADRSRDYRSIRFDAH